MKKILIIGGGAAGCAAAVFAAERGAQVELFEHNEKLGKKLFITGKGRCNFTNCCGMEELFDSIVSNPKFLYSAFYGFTNQQTVEWIESIGVRTKVERGNRAFPLSDHSSDITRALERRCRELGVMIHLNTHVREILTGPGSDPSGRSACGILLFDGKKVYGDAVLLATGGLSYKTTGSDGSGHRMAERHGIRVTEMRPALVPLETGEQYISDMQGLSLKNVSLTVRDGKKNRYQGFGEMLFTHFGISGPLVLSASSMIGRYLTDTHPLQGSIDLKPALSEEQLEKRILRELENGKNKQFRNILPELVPAKMQPVILKLSGISGNLKGNEITKEQRQKIVSVLKKLPFTITGQRGYNEAIITQGGIHLKDVDPATMESKKIKGLYFAGEILDVDGVTGGFNLQIAWSTAYAAARAMTGEET